MFSKFTTLDKLVKLCEILAEKFHGLLLLAFWTGLFLRLLAGPKAFLGFTFGNTIHIWVLKTSLCNLY